MIRSFLVFLLATQALSAKQKITVLDVKMQTGRIGDEEKNVLEELIRAAVTKNVTGKMIMMDKESLYEILKDSGIDPAKCSAAECEVEVFRRMQADFGVTPVLLGIGDRLKLILKLHRSSNGEVLSSVDLDGSNIADFAKGLVLEVEVGKLLAPLQTITGNDTLGSVEAKVTVEQGKELPFKQLESLVVTLISEPPEADLYIDDRLIGSTGKSGSKQPLTFGRHTIRIEKANYLPTSTFIETRKDMLERTFTYKLESSLRRIRLLSTPEQDAEVFIGGEPVGSTPITRELKIGSYEVTMRKADYLPAKRELAIDRTTPDGQDLTVELTPNFGLLTLTSQPDGIAVFVDAERIGTTPINDHRLTLGVHDIALQDRRYFTVTIEKLQVAKPLQLISEHFAMEQKFGGIDIACHDENNSLVIAEVSIDGHKVGETSPRYQQKLPVGEYSLKITTPHRTFEDTFELNEHGDMYQKDILLNSLSDEEIEAIAITAIKKKRSEKSAILFPALLAGLASGGGAGYFFKKSRSFADSADAAKAAYTNSSNQLEMDRHLNDAEELDQKSLTSLLGATALTAVSLGALGLAIYEALTLPNLPVRKYDVRPLIDTDTFGLTFGGCF